MTDPDVGTSRKKKRLHSQQEALFDLTTHDAVVDGDFERAAEVITQTAAHILDVSRVSIWLFDDDNSRMHCVKQFDRQTGTYSDGIAIDIDDCPTYFEALQQNRSVAVDDARTDSRTAELSDYVGEHGIGALLDATLRSEGEIVGVVCSENLGASRVWADHEIEFAGDLADIVHRALRNRESARQGEQLAYRQSLLSAQQEAIPGGIVVIADDGAILSYNDRFRDLFEIPETLLETGTDEAVFDRIEPQVADADGLRKRMAQLRGDAETQAEGEFRRIDGRVFEWYSAPVTDDQGTYYGRLWSVEEITERREREAELERKDRAIENAPIGIAMSDATAPDNPIVYANGRLTELTGYSEAEILGRNLRFLQGEATDPEPVEALRTAIDEERPITVELRNYCKDGGRFWNRVSVAPVENEDGDVVNYVGFQENVSERKEVSRQLTVLHRMLRHDLANQLTIIRGTAEQLDERTDAAATVVEKVDELTERIEKHRTIVQLLSDRPSPKALNVDAVIDRLAGEIRQEFPETELRVDRESGVTVAAIPAFERALRELLTNAIDHGQQTAQTVTLSVETTASTVTVRVADCGEGLPESERAILHGDTDIEPLNHGTGMGLWLVYWIAMLSEGSISVAENEPQGTVVSVEFPRGESARSGRRRNA